MFDFSRLTAYGKSCSHWHQMGPLQLWPRVEEVRELYAFSHMLVEILLFIMSIDSYVPAKLYQGLSRKFMLDIYIISYLIEWNINIGTDEWASI